MRHRVFFLVGLALLALSAAACSVLLRTAPDAAAPTEHPDRPAAPAPPDGDFRPDSASLVAATGRPQLIEFFAFW